jgi:Tol biopolymer transport system component
VGTPGGVYVVSSSGEATKVSGEVPRILTIAPSWSPDGKQLAFAGVEDLNGDGKYRDDEAAIYVCDVEKGPPKRVATVNTMGLRLLWSPVASQLILQVKKPNVPVPVAHLLDLRSGKLTSRDDATTVGCWSPDGQHIAAYSMLDRKIHVLHTDGSEEYGLDTPSGYVGELLWLPANTKDSIEDAERLLVVSASQPMSSMSGQLHIRSAFPGGGEAWKRLTDDETNAAYLAASPDGRYVAYTLLTGHEPEPTGDLYVLEIGQDEPRRLTSAPGFEGLATWIPTGKRER